MSRTNSNSSRALFYILAGQSNMNGHGFVKDLPPELNKQQEGVWIYNPNRGDDQQEPDPEGYWEIHQPGHGSGAAVNKGQRILSDRFGPELSFAKRIREKKPNHTILIYKYAKGGSSIHPKISTGWGCWDPDYTLGNGINQWTHFSYHLHRCLKKAEENFGAIRISGILWHQGESDASHTRSIAEVYENKLTRLLNSMREEIGDGKLPVAVGRISDSMMGRGKRNTTYPFGEIVMAAQQKFTKKDPQSALVTLPDGHGFIDEWHYDSQAYIDLGHRFAEAIMKSGKVKLGD